MHALLCLLFDKVTKHQSTCKEVFYTAVFYYRTTKRKKDTWFPFASAMNNMNPNLAGLNNLFSQWVAAQAPGSTTQGPALGQPQPNPSPPTTQTNPSPNPQSTGPHTSPATAGTQLNQLGNQFFQFLHAQQASSTDSRASPSAAPASNPSPPPQPASTSSHAEMFNAFQQWIQSGAGSNNQGAAKPFHSASPPTAQHAASTINFANLQAGGSALAIQNQRRALQGMDSNQGKGGKGGSPDQIICPGCGGPHGWQSCPYLAQHEDTVFNHIIVTEQARYERDQNRARINAKIMAADLDPLAFGFNRRSNGQNYAGSVNVMAQLSGGSAATPNYGAPPPFPAPGPSPPMGHVPTANASTPTPNAAEMFQRFQEFMAKATHDNRPSPPSGGFAPNGTATSATGRQRTPIDADTAEFVDVVDTPVARDKRKRCDRTPGNDDTRSPAAKRGEPGEGDDVLRELFSDIPDPAPQDPQDEIAQLQRQAADAKRRLAELRGAKPAARSGPDHVPGTLDIHARRCLTHALRAPKENDTVFVISYSPAESKYTYKKSVVQQIDRDFVYVLPADLPEDAMDDTAPTVHERHWLFRDETRAASAMSALSDLLSVN